MKISTILVTLALGLFWVSPALAAKAELRVKPSVIVLDPTAQKTATALVGVRVTGSASDRVELVGIKTNVGQLSKATKKGKATWTATFTPPNLRFPTVALLHVDVKINGKLVRLWKAIPVSIKLKLPVAAKGAVEISVSVENREFGPVTPKKRQKEISIPVIITPSAANYTISRITEKGVTSAETKRFALPKFPRMVVVGPTSAPAGSTIRLDVFHVGAKGKRYTYNVPVIADCAVGEITKLRGRRSEQSIWIKLGGNTGASQIRVASKQDPKVAVVHRLNVELANNLKLAMTLSKASLHMSSTKIVKVLVRVTDLFGNRARTSTLAVTANGKPLSISRLEPGLWRGWLYAPAKRQPRDQLMLVASAPRAASSKAVVKLLGGVAVKLSIRLGATSIQADGKRGVDVFINATDAMGMAPADKTIKVESAQGKMAYLHRVVPGRFQGKFIPARNTKGGFAAVTASTYRAHLVSARLRLIPIPQHMLLSTTLGTLSDTSRAVGIEAGLRFEYSVYNGPPAVHIGIQALMAPHFGVGNKVEADEFVGFSAGVAAMARLRMVSHGRFGLDAVVDVGVLGIYSTYKRSNPPVVDNLQRGKAAFTTSFALEAGFRTLRRNEFFVQFRVRYLTAGLPDATSDNHVTLFAGLGYRFEL